LQEWFFIFVQKVATETFLIAQLSLKTRYEGKGIEGFDPLALSVILSGKLFSFPNHAVNLFLTKTAFLIFDGDMASLSTNSERLTHITNKGLATCYRRRL